LITEKKGQNSSVLTCSFCNKQYSSANSYAQHLKSKKHLEKETTTKEDVDKPITQGKEKEEPLTQLERQQIEFMIEPTTQKEQTIKEDDTKEGDIKESNTTVDQTEMDLIDERIKNARTLSLDECLFCSLKSSNMERNLDHMTQEHGFFIPDIEYLKDLEGLIKYLGEKISIGNVCLYCNGKGKSFMTLEAVQGHMRALNHCKLLYDENDDEYGNFYDFSSDWEGIPTTEHDDETHQKSAVTVSEDGSELIFQNGKSVGHRSYQVYYRQRYKPADTRESVVINSLITQYHALGWTDKWHKEQIEKRTADKIHADSFMKLGVKANTLQRHFRKQIL